MDKLIALGTGAARAMRYYNTCFMLQGAEGSLLVDAGGGNGILLRLEAAGIPLASLTDLFVTHEHIDHSLGVIWIVRMVSTLHLKGGRDRPLRIHCHARLAEKLEWICRATLSANQCAPIGSHILFMPVRDGEERHIAGHSATFFDIRSHKAEQYGFCLRSPEGQTVVCSGDEPLCRECFPLARGADWLLHEAFCLEADAGVFDPHKIGHGTVAEAARTADELGVKDLVLWHTEDSRTVGRRKELYSAEARRFFGGGVFVPDDLDVVDLHGERAQDRPF